MLIGDRVLLTAVEREDLPFLKNWRNNPEFRKYFREYRELNDAMQELWFENKVVRDHTTEMFALRERKTNELLGCCGLVYINWLHRHADFSIYIGWQAKYIDDAGYAEESCRLLLRYAFAELNLNKVWTEIYEFDQKKLDLYTKLGFRQDGLLRQNYFYDGRWWDSRMLSLLADEFCVAE